MEPELKLSKDYYRGYEGEVEYIFTILDSAETLFHFSVWEGFFSPLVESLGKDIPKTLDKWFENLDTYWAENVEHEWVLDPTEMLDGLEKARWDNLVEYKNMDDHWEKDVGLLLKDLESIMKLAISNNWSVKLKQD